MRYSPVDVPPIGGSFDDRPDYNRSHVASTSALHRAVPKELGLPPAFSQTDKVDSHPTLEDLRGTDQVHAAASGWLEAGQQTHHSLLCSLLPGPVANAAYYGSGPDAEWLMLVANPAHGWMFDRIAAVPKASSENGYEPIGTTREMAEWLQKVLDAGNVKPYRHGFFQCEMNASRDLGLKVLGNLQALGAEDMHVEAADDRCLDIHFRWRHPQDATVTERTISIVNTPGANGEHVGDERGFLKYTESLPPMQFLMTRGLNYVGNDIPPLQSLVRDMTPGGVAFLDFALQHVPVAEHDSDRDWSQHGALHVYRWEPYKSGQAGACRKTSATCPASDRGGRPPLAGKPAKPDLP